ncbi:glycine--tRNA ligase subunit beta [Stenoxybacter acetivorans]|uniref:glycine--tRNA ligase subunit beta n=1 Tax=Stenoxybacter acetivorans TaxID=422441 RepID=UPI000564F5AD|nr:glycine--tRNA ligase subunit beta [Stenoxybacter acetivorans]
MSTQPLLIELRTEELPPKALKRLGNSLADAVAEGLAKEQLIDGTPNYQAFASPRRLAVLVQNVRAVQADRQIIKKGPSVAAGMKDGVPTKALAGFARANNIDIGCLKQINDGNQMVFAHEYAQAGQPLSALLSEILAQAVKKLPIPKVMRWGSSTHTFVRPVHGLVMMHGKSVVAGSVLGLESQNQTLGHRFLSSGAIVFEHAEDYAKNLREQGKVIADFEERRCVIEADLQWQAQQLHARVAADDALLDEVCALVEWPAVLQAGFEARFLQVPQECLILTMQQNQKYFPLLDEAGKLMNRFLLVSNLQSDDPAPIIHGNERVLRARLSDAEFFFKQDQKQTLESRLPRLAQVVYHNQLGNQAERAERIRTLAQTIAQSMNIDLAKTDRAVRLAKADLLTEMVGEFPELQGTMGKYYALHDGEDAEVAQAIEEHYQPRFAGDALPQTAIGTALALADKLETLVGIWGIGLVPTGDKDPYALRRSALGVLRMLMTHRLDAQPLLQAAADTFPQGKLAANTVAEVSEFMRARLAVLLQTDYAHDEVAAVLAHWPQNLGDIQAKLQAVAAFKQLPEAEALAAANKRVHNLLKKADTATLPAVSADLLTQPAEQNLYAATQAVSVKIAAALAQHDFQAALTVLADIRPKVDAFFEDIMVMGKDETLKNNRLALLNELSRQMNAVADIAQLQAA